MRIAASFLLLTTSILLGPTPAHGWLAVRNLSSTFQGPGGIGRVSIIAEEVLRPSAKSPTCGYLYSATSKMSYLGLPESFQFYSHARIDVDINSQYLVFLGAVGDPKPNSAGRVFELFDCPSPTPYFAYDGYQSIFEIRRRYLNLFGPEIVETCGDGFLEVLELRGSGKYSLSEVLSRLDELKDSLGGRAASPLIEPR